MRTSSVAVRPRMSLALAVSCTPGSCTTMRSRPCCWITGSATPSSLIRLCRVTMFCLSACSCTRRAASGLMVAVSLYSVPSGASATCRSGNWSAITALAASSVWVSRKRTSMAWPLRLMPPWRTFFSRSMLRRSPASDSAFLVSAACMSTCSMKCTPPRRSRPRYIGAARSADSHVGEPDSRFSATTYGGSLGSGTRAFWIASLALSWVSVLSSAHLDRIGVQGDGIGLDAGGRQRLLDARAGWCCPP